MADPDSSLSPEKRLLKLIEEPQQEGKSAKPAVLKRPFALKALLSPQVFKENLDAAHEFIFGYWKKNKDKFGMREVNKAGAILTVAITLFLLISGVNEVRTLDKSVHEGLEIPQHKMSDILSLPVQELSGIHLEQAEPRNVFIPFVKKEDPRAAQQQQNDAKLADATKNFKLTGISYNPTDAKNAFCMVEDIGKDMTTFLREGDSIGGLKVKKIEEDHIVLSGDNDQTIEMR